MLVAAGSIRIHGWCIFYTRHIRELSRVPRMQHNPLRKIFFNAYQSGVELVDFVSTVWVDFSAQIPYPPVDLFATAL